MSLEEHYNQYIQAGLERQYALAHQITCQARNSLNQYTQADWLWYWKRFEASMVERLLSEHRGGVIDFGGSQSVYEDEGDFARVQRALVPYPNVVLVLPSPDLDESLRVLKGRSWDGVAGGFDFQAHFVKHPSNQRLAKINVYTEDKSPEETCREILGRLTL